MTHRCLISCIDYCESKQLTRDLRSGDKRLDVTIMHVDADDNELGETTYTVTAYWESGGWEIRDIEPEPPSEFVTDKICEEAAYRLDRAVADALDEAFEYARGM